MYVLGFLFVLGSDTGDLIKELNRSAILEISTGREGLFNPLSNHGNCGSGSIHLRNPLDPRCSPGVAHPNYIRHPSGSPDSFDI